VQDIAAAGICNAWWQFLGNSKGAVVVETNAGGRAISVEIPQNSWNFQEIRGG
jgi:hypothetical protein